MPAAPSLQRVGGWSALLEALAYLLGFAGMALLLDPGAAARTPAERLAFVLGRKGLIQGWNLVLYGLGSLPLLPLTLALRERLRARAPLATQMAAPLGLIWVGLLLGAGMIASVGLETVARLHAQDPALALPVWVTLSVVENGLGGGIEVVGGLWSLLLSAAAWKARAFPKALNALGLIVGAAGVLTAVPAWRDLAAVFGIGQILWFIGVGVSMLRRPSAA